MRKQPIERALPIVAGALGRKFGVQVAIGGDQAATDGKTIVLPSSAMDEEKDVLWGYLAHEAAHVRYTDFEPFKAAADRPLRKAILNILEDVRIEQALAGPFPGTRRTIAKTLARMKERGELAFDKDAKPPVILHDYLLFRLRHEVLGQKILAAEAEAAEAAVRETFPPGLVTRLHGLLSEVPSLQSTREALALADRILRMVREELEKQQKPDASGQNVRSGQSGQSGVAQGQGNPDGQAQANSQSDPDGNDGDAAAGAAPDGKPEDGDGGRDGASTPGQGGGRDRDDGREGADPGAGAGSGGGRVCFQDMEQAQEQDFLDPFRKIRDRMEASGGRGWVLPITLELRKGPDPKRVAEVRRETTKLRAALQGLIQASRLERDWRRDHGRRLDSRRLAGTAVGDWRVFRHKLEKPMPNTAVQLVIDRSGSMSTRIRSATDAALALALALEGIPGVRLGVSAFPGETENEILELLPHGQRVESIAANFRLFAYGGTPMDTAIWHAAACVLACREQRKAIVVVTDGEPSDLAATTEVIERCRLSNIDVYGIGIGVDVSHLFQKAALIEGVEELAQSLFELSRDLLIAA